MPLHSSLSRREMVNYAQYKTIESWMNTPYATTTPYLSFPTWSVKCKTCTSSQSLMCSGVTTMLGLRLEMRKKERSKWNTVSSSHWSCSSALLTRPAPFKWWWTISSETCTLNTYKLACTSLFIWMISWSPCPLHCRIMKEQSTMFWPDLKTMTSIWNLRSVFGRCRSWLPGGNPWEGGDLHEPHQNFRYCQLAHPQNSQRCPLVPRILLLTSDVVRLSGTYLILLIRIRL